MILAHLHNCFLAIPNSISSSTLFLPRMYFSSLSSSMDLCMASRSGSFGVRDRRGVSRRGRESLGAVFVFNEGEVVGFSCIDFLFDLSIGMLIGVSGSSISSSWERFVRDLFWLKPWNKVILREREREREKERERERRPQSYSVNFDMGGVQGEGGISSFFNSFLVTPLSTE